MNITEIQNSLIYGYDLLELYDNATSLSSNWTTMKSAINNSFNTNMKVGLNYVIDFNISNSTMRTNFKNNITNSFPDLLLDPYSITVVYISLEVNNTSLYSDLELSTQLNDIAENLTQAMKNKFVVYSKNYLKYPSLHLHSGSSLTFKNSIYLLHFKQLDSL